MRYAAPMVFVASLVSGGTGIEAQIPRLPAGALSDWRIEGPEELVGWRTFDPTSVRDRLPADLRFVTVGELAESGIQWAQEHLDAHRAVESWGVSFLEVIRATSFSIDGRQPVWPLNGGAALWFARVARRNPQSAPDFGTPFLAMEFWVPDAEFVTFMRSKGHFATYGAVSMKGTSATEFIASVDVPELQIRGACVPATADMDGPRSAGAQTLVPPAGSGVLEVVRVAFAGHRERACRDQPQWVITGSHPLSATIPVEGLSMQSGYSLRGAAFRR